MSDSETSPCPNCGTPNPPQSRFCKQCSYPLGVLPTREGERRTTAPAGKGNQRDIPKQRAGTDRRNEWTRPGGIGCLGFIAVVLVLSLAFSVCSTDSGGDDELNGESTEKTLTGAQWSSVAGELTKMALARDWCHKRTGGLDSRDMEILVIHAESIAEILFGPGPYFLDESQLRQTLLQRGWSEFRGPDLNRGGTEMRYRPPGCG